jgi:hypothetical protein
MPTLLPISVEVSPEAAEFVLAKGGALMLRSTLKHGCCGGRVELVKAEACAPEDDTAFDRFELDQVTLYAERGLFEGLNQAIHIGLDRLFSLRSLYVEGVPARM